MRCNTSVSRSLGCGVKNLRKVSIKPACNSSNDDKVRSGRPTNKALICLRGSSAESLESSEHDNSEGN